MFKKRKKAYQSEAENMGYLNEINYKKRLLKAVEGIETQLTTIASVLGKIEKNRKSK